MTMELWVAEMEKIRSSEKRKSRSEDIISDGLFKWISTLPRMIVKLRMERNYKLVANIFSG